MRTVVSPLVVDFRNFEKSFQEMIFQPRDRIDRLELYLAILLFVSTLLSLVDTCRTRFVSRAGRPAPAHEHKMYVPYKGWVGVIVTQTTRCSQMWIGFVPVGHRGLVDRVFWRGPITTKVSPTKFKCGCDGLARVEGGKIVALTALLRTTAGLDGGGQRSWPIIVRNLAGRPVTTFVRHPQVGWTLDPPWKSQYQSQLSSIPMQNWFCFIHIHSGFPCFQVNHNNVQTQRPAV